ncbi:hypothetical protein M407DRAFT_240472 [Tulasnella calospora MUT 4182]|uniref:Uncharacterized protein n=1 Tax=Tulasnella calospora MUT 4182 TaxID=1051891 RepID=A0A0C3QZ15_9AGAM|nr:hypothetical protein M407DRAFT_240472 [Tulasnella calospora MUT 4182]
MPCPQLKKLTLIVDARWPCKGSVANLLKARKLSCRELVVYDEDGRIFDLASVAFRRQ